MNIMKRFTLILLLLIGSMGLSQAQTKVGYTNVELILAYMPETQAMEKSLKTVQDKLSEQLEIKQKYYQQKMTEFMQAQQSGQYTEQQMGFASKELEKLQGEIQQGLQMAEQQLFKKRMELLNPIQKKMQAAIDAVAKEKGYTFILNMAMGSGIPSILYGNESDDVTKDIAQKLGIDTEE